MKHDNQADGPRANKFMAFVVHFILSIFKATKAKRPYLIPEKNLVAEVTQDRYMVNKAFITLEDCPLGFTLYLLLLFHDLECCCHAKVLHNHHRLIGCQKRFTLVRRGFTNLHLIHEKLEKKDGCIAMIFNRSSA